MGSTNPFAPPTAAVSHQLKSHLPKLWGVVLAVFVLFQTAFTIWYFPMFMAIARHGEISVIQLVAIAFSNALLPIGTLMMLLRWKGAVSIFAVAATVGLLSLFPSVFYNMLTCSALALAGVGLAFRQARYGRETQVIGGRKGDV